MMRGRRSCRKRNLLQETLTQYLTECENEEENEWLENLEKEEQVAMHKFIVNDFKRSITDYFTYG